MIDVAIHLDDGPAAGQERVVWEVGAQHQQHVTVLDGVIPGRVSDEAGHADHRVFGGVEDVLRAQRMDDWRSKACGQGQHLVAGVAAPDAAAAVENAYSRGENDEFVLPTVVGEPAPIADGDAIDVQALPGAAQDGPESGAALIETREKFGAALAALPDEQREAFVREVERRERTPLGRVLKVFEVIGCLLLLYVIAHALLNGQ